MFFIPAAAIGAGVSLIVWGSKMFLDDDDSADEKAGEILARIPEEISEYIEDVRVNLSGIHIVFRPGTPKKIKDQVRNNIEPV
ncbi:MAG: hypothetical protein GX442_00400 [Candidatus Riflebacteria bacterium]|nr:hypothetical protein [Candidatus Riflebacteria bacterium]